MKSRKSTNNIVVLKPSHQAKPRNYMDWLKWALSVVLLLAGLAANHYYSEVSMPIRMLAWVGVLIVAGFVASRTSTGGLVLSFFRDSKMELRKVVWPTREETMQMTLLVGAMVVVLALILWGMDSILVWVVGWLTGQRG